MRRFPLQLPYLIWTAVPMICLLAGPMFCIGPRAQGNQGEATVGIYYGAVDVDSYGAVDADSDGLWGLRFGYHLNDDWSLEFSGQRSELDTVLGDADLDSFRSNLVFNFRPFRPLRPYVTFGFGLEQLEVLGVDELDFSVNGGGGLRWYAAPAFGLRGDLRAVFGESGLEVVSATRGRGRDHEHGFYRFDDSSQINLELSVGLFVVF